ncbi:hypothetical protein BB558_007175 [Smittium angustum]|uniref:Phenylalanine--tRNA ligase, mitochondrial n=1 Tax=Smittium angustum TaxID=133377 RepID=A0A2U1IVQ8_SMIAN|nr:hypothetical protein BB558_007175 [Smittium angustum]
MSRLWQTTNKIFSRSNSLLSTKHRIPLSISHLSKGPSRGQFISTTVTPKIQKNLNQRENAAQIQKVSPENDVPSNGSETEGEITILGAKYKTDEWTNINKAILDKVGRNLLNTPTHPTRILKDIIFSQFPTYAHYDSIPSPVTTYANFDSLYIPKDHPGRAKTDNYYINKDNLLRAHTSAHQVQLMKAGINKEVSLLNLNKNEFLKEKQKTSNDYVNINRRFLVAADVFRRDEIDSSHYPAFHQLEGVVTLSQDNLEQEIATEKSIRESAQQQLLLKLGSKSNLQVETHDDTLVSSANPYQDCHDPKQVDMIANDMKETMNSMVATILSQAIKVEDNDPNSPAAGKPNVLPVRWIEAYFPFTSPSWEMEVWWNGEWLEICGCGVMKQGLLKNAGLENQIGWAFGFGLDRLAMILFGVPDIRLFWSNDKRFLNQFTPGKITTFTPFSKYPPCHKDVSFWVNNKIDGKDTENSTESIDFHENDLMDLVRELAGDLVQDVTLIDKYTNKKTNKTSLCYRINYCSMDRNVTNLEINEIQESVRKELLTPCMEIFDP